jgi:hypothetical protein
MKWEFLPNHFASIEGNPSEGVKKSSRWLKRKGRVDWRSFGAQPLEIEPLCRKLA